MDDIDRTLIGFLGLVGSPAPEDLLEELKAEQSREYMPYHNWSHIEYGLKLLHRHRDKIPDFDAVLLAWLNHDRVYDPAARDNEQVSADLAWGLCLQLNVGAKADMVRALVLDTRHKALPRTEAGRWLVGVDLAILGETPDIYDKYEADIRKEHAFVDDEVYRLGRRRLLRNFLDRDAIYLVPELYDQFEVQARENLNRALDAL